MNIAEIYQKHRNVIMYGVIGVTAMVVDVVFFLIFFNIFLIPPTISTVMSVTVAMIYAFSLNAIYNFKTKDLIKSRFASYALVSMVGMVVSVTIIKGLVLLAIDANIAKILSLPPIVLVQYFFNKTFTFKETI